MNIQTLSTIISALAVLLAGWMACETRKMAKVSQEALNLEKTPILGVSDILVEVSDIHNVEQVSTGNALQALGGIRIGLLLFNAGKVPLKYSVNRFEVSFAQQVADIEKYLSKGSTILPGSSASFWHSGITLNPPIETFPNTGRLSIDLSYSDANGQHTQRLEEVIEYTLSGAAPGSRNNWLHVDETLETGNRVIQ